MGVDNQYLLVIKKTFLEYVDESQLKPRCRAVSDFTGMCQVKHEELRESAGHLSPVSSRPSGQLSPVSSQSSGVEVSLEIAEADEQHMTVMMRNIPNSYNANSLVSMLDSQGFHGRYDFAYLPIDFRTGVNLGYAFVNLVDHSDAVELFARLQGFCGWDCQSQKVCEVSWARPHQGLSEHVERYRNSPVMHEGVPDAFKPRLFKDGQRLIFPPPTKRIRAPRVRPARRQ